MTSINHKNDKRKPSPVSKNLSLNPAYKYCNCNYSSRAKMIKTKAKSTMPEIARNPVPPDKSLVLSPTPVIDFEIVTVNPDSIPASSFYAWLDLSLIHI